LDYASCEIDALRDLYAMNVHGGVVAALGENVDQHGESKRVFEYGVFRIDVSDTGDRMPKDDRHHLLLDESHDFLQQFSMFEGVTV
jgi:hypothetical protein